MQCSFLVLVMELFVLNIRKAFHSLTSNGGVNKVFEMGLQNNQCIS